MSNRGVVGYICLVVFVFLLLIVGAMYGLPKYNVYSRELSGYAQLKESEWNKKVAIEEAKAKEESAKYHAAAEIARARGVAEANKIIGDSLKDNDAYLRYLWIMGLQDSNGETVYIATEAGLPILEANRKLQSGN